MRDGSVIMPSKRVRIVASPTPRRLRPPVPMRVTSVRTYAGFVPGQVKTATLLVTVWAETYVPAMPFAGHGPVVGVTASVTSVPAKVTQSPSVIGIWMLADGAVSGPAPVGEQPAGTEFVGGSVQMGRGSFVFTIAAKPVAGAVASGRCDMGQSASTPVAGSMRGRHMGKPVAEAIVGLSWSTMKRRSCVRPTL